MMRILVGLSLIGLLFAPQAVHAQSIASESEGTSYFSPTKILAFADFLRERGDFDRAVSEYQRYLFSPGAKNQSYAHFQLGTSFRELDAFQQASLHYLKAAQNGERSTFRDSSYVRYLGALLAGGSSTRFFQVVDTLGFESQASQAQLRRITALAHLQKAEWEKAKRVLSQSSGMQERDLESSRVADLISRGMRLPQKSPTVAGVLSTVLPGTGKMYAGRTSDGLYSLALIGGASWLAYQGFEDKGTSSVKGWLFGSVGAVLYAGNIYGSVVAVRLYNARQKEGLQNDIQAEISISTRF